MSYQIKRTPYFRRMFNNSRRNGQLQRLREEYERIQEFNDRTIELKMRQVRLKRLFREIEDINESPSISNTLRQRQQPLTLLPLSPEAQQAQQRRERLEALERARELGQEISRRNAELAENGTGFYLRSELRSTAKMRAADEARRQAQERRERAARRISYGNAQSRSNIERIAQRRQRLEVIDSLLYRTDIQSAQVQVLEPNQLHPDIIKRSMLQQRLQYGNSRSTHNMARSQIAAAQRVMNCISVADEDHLQEDLLLEMEPQDHQRYNNHNHIMANSTNDHADNIDNTKNNVTNAESDLEMQTALEPDTLHSSQFNDDDVPTTSQKALKIANVETAMTPKIAGFQSRRPSRVLCESPSEQASERWHPISLTLPSIKVIDDRSIIAPGESQLPNISISITEDLDSSRNTTVPTPETSDNYQSSRRPSLMQEDLMQIMELDDDGQANPPDHVEHRTFCK